MSSIRRQVNIAATQRAVWNAFTSVDGWTSWYADEARCDARVGGRVVLVADYDDDENPIEEAGVFHKLRPTSKLEIAFDRCPTPMSGARLAIQLARDGDETRVSMVLSKAEALSDDEQREELDATWRRAFSALQSALDS